MGKIHIHFVCTGNIFRSRLAEAYLKSKSIPNIEVSSSGTEADRQNKGPITWYALRLSQKYGIVSFLSPQWKDTTAEDIRNADIVVFIGKNNYDYCKEHFPSPKKYEIWELQDFDDKDLYGKPLNIPREVENLTISENVFTRIKENTEALIKTYHLLSL